MGNMSKNRQHKTVDHPCSTYDRDMANKHMDDRRKAETQHAGTLNTQTTSNTHRRPTTSSRDTHE